MGTLELIYGCMFSGKTSKLIDRYNELKDITNEQATEHWNTLGKSLFKNGSCYDEYNNLFGHDEALPH